MAGTGSSMMPILPCLGDTDENLEATIRCTAERGGCLVIAQFRLPAGPQWGTAKGKDDPSTPRRAGR